MVYGGRTFLRGILELELEIELYIFFFITLVHELFCINKRTIIYYNAMRGDFQIQNAI